MKQFYVAIILYVNNKNEIIQTDLLSNPRASLKFIHNWLLWFKLIYQVFSLTVYRIKLENSFSFCSSFWFFKWCPTRIYYRSSFIYSFCFNLCILLIHLDNHFVFRLFCVCLLSASSAKPFWIKSFAFYFRNRFYCNFVDHRRTLYCLHLQRNFLHFALL